MILLLVCLQPGTKAARKSASKKRKSVQRSTAAARSAGTIFSCEPNVYILTHDLVHYRKISSLEITSNMDADNMKNWSVLSAVISLQTAEGYWWLDQNLTKILQHNLSDLEKACPTTDTVWATILALVALEKKFGSTKDEWELVAMKAEHWLKKQSIPNIKDLRSAAQKCLA